MSLDFDLSKVKATTRKEDGTLTDVTESIIFATMTTHLGDILENNWAEFYSRYVIACRLRNYPPFFSATDVHNHVGLHTNVGSSTRAQWIRDWVHSEMFEISLKAKKEIEAKQAIIEGIQDALKPNGNI